MAQRADNEFLMETGREHILNEAKKMVCGDRDKQYGSPEDSFRAIAGLWSKYLDIDISPRQACEMMILFKVARMKTGYGKEDNYIDCAGYAACAGELAKNDNMR